MALFPGTTRTVTFTCRDADDELADPTTLEVEYRRLYDDPVTKAWPADAEVVHDSTGVFHIDIVCTEAGTWAARGGGTGSVVDVAEISWTIEESSFD